MTTKYSEVLKRLSPPSSNSHNKDGAILVGAHHGPFSTGSAPRDPEVTSLEMGSSTSLEDPVLESLKQALSTRDKCSVEDPLLTPAAVLILIYPHDGDHRILLNKRSYSVEHHKGEISFPGGGRDPEDRDFVDTALRETQEEMGIEPRHVIILGQLDDVTTRSNFAVRVFVGTIPYPYPFHPSPSEIDEVIEIPISVLRNPANAREEVQWVDGRTHTRYSYAYGERLVHGVTAQMLTQFLELLAEGTAEREQLG